MLVSVIYKVMADSFQSQRSYMNYEIKDYLKKCRDVEPGKSCSMFI